MEVSVDAVFFCGPGAGPGGAPQVLLRSQKLSACGRAFHGGLLVGEGLSQVQVDALGRRLHVRGSGNGMWCHDEAHRTQHHYLHEERSSRLRRTLTTSRMFSFCGVLRGAALILALRSGFALSTLV